MPPKQNIPHPWPAVYIQDPDLVSIVPSDILPSNSVKLAAGTMMTEMFDILST